MMAGRITLFAVVFILTAIVGIGNAAIPSQPEDGKKILESFKLKGLDGVMHPLAEWQGKVIMLNFWASWCAPCQAEIRDFVRLQAEYGPRGLQIIGLGLDDEHKLRNVARTLMINYPVLVTKNPGANRELLAVWGNSKGVVPYTVVIDKSGKPAYIHRGPMDHEAFLDNVAPLLEM